MDVLTGAVVLCLDDGQGPVGIGARGELCCRVSWSMIRPKDCCGCGEAGYGRTCILL